MRVSDEEAHHRETNGLHPPGFLWPIEHDLLHHFMSLQNEVFTWDDSEHGHSCEDFFPPIKIPVITHTGPSGTF